MACLLVIVVVSVFMISSFSPGISLYNVMPPEAGIYFNKIQCFCFEEQMLNPRKKDEGGAASSSSPPSSVSILLASSYPRAWS